MWWQLGELHILASYQPTWGDRKVMFPLVIASQGVCLQVLATSRVFLSIKHFINRTYAYLSKSCLYRNIACKRTVTSKELQFKPNDKYYILIWEKRKLMRHTFILILFLKMTKYDTFQKMQKATVRISVTSKLPWGSLSKYFSFENALTSIEHWHSYHYNLQKR